MPLGSVVVRGLPGLGRVHRARFSAGRQRQSLGGLPGSGAATPPCRPQAAETGSWPTGSLPRAAGLVTPRALFRLHLSAGPSRPESRRPPWRAPRRADGRDERRTAAPESREAQRVRKPGHHTGRTGPLRSAACLVRELRSCRLPRVVPPDHRARRALPYVLVNTLPGGSLPMYARRTPTANGARRSPCTCPPKFSLNVYVVPARKVGSGVPSAGSRWGRLWCVRRPAPACRD
jgi:hypothetical protein